MLEAYLRELLNVGNHICILGLTIVRILQTSQAIRATYLVSTNYFCYLSQLLIFLPIVHELPKRTNRSKAL